VSAKQDYASLAVVAGAVGTAGIVAWAGGFGGVTLMGMSVMAWCASLAFLTQWLAFVPAYIRQTERFYDLTGSLTYIGVTLFALAADRSIEGRSALLALLVIVWAGRLGSFLFRRIQAEGSDARFDSIKPSALRFWVAWTLQGLWVFLTLCAALAAITSSDPAPLRVRDGLGLLIWIAGFVDTGLWAWSRHPNYFGEIVLWTGIAVIASSTLRGWQWVTLVSPVFVVFLLTRVSGIPILEKRADERWGDDAAYQRYKENTPVLVPRPPTR
jgi:steroid 5-alpha reductase family enzyme